MKTLIAFLLLILAALGCAQIGSTSIAITYDVTARRTLYDVTYQPLATQHDLFGVKGFDAVPLAIVGANDNGSASFGGVVAVPFNVSKESLIYVGVGVRAISGDKPRGLVYLALAKRF